MPAILLLLDLQLDPAQAGIKGACVSNQEWSCNLYSYYKYLKLLYRFAFSLQDHSGFEDPPPLIFAKSYYI